LPIVYILNKGPHDYSEARKFGELVVCTDGSLDKWDTSQLYRELSTAMQDSHQDDFLLLTSLASLCGIACAIFAVKHGRINLLIHRGEGYISRTIMLSNGTKENNVPRILRRPHENQ